MKTKRYTVENLEQLLAVLKTFPRNAEVMNGLGEYLEVKLVEENGEVPYLEFS